MIDIFVDVEADGPCPGVFSMVSVGMVVYFNGKITGETFYAEFAPISEKYIEAALAVSSINREQHLKYKDAKESTESMLEWLNTICEKYSKDGAKKQRLCFISDNNGFDWQFVNYYLWNFCNQNPFGHSSTNLSSLYKGMMNSRYVNHKHLRITKHTHNPVDDAKGNAEAYEQMVNKFNFNKGTPKNDNRDPTNKSGFTASTKNRQRR